MILIIGFVGLFLLLIAFILNLINKIQKESIIYLACNIAGAGLLAFYAYITQVIPFLILESVWVIFSIYKLFFRNKS